MENRQRWTFWTGSLIGRRAVQDLKRRGLTREGLMSGAFHFFSSFVSFFSCSISVGVTRETEMKWLIYKWVQRSNICLNCCQDKKINEYSSQHYYLILIHFKKTHHNVQLYTHGSCSVQLQSDLHLSRIFSLPINKEEESVIMNVKSYIAWLCCLKFMYKLDSKRTMLC